ncbi:hypothetical protein BT96DRAFT_916595 [Gymnopus androsaceus JB14]|uniref:G protein-coupled receptor n=1 Tax=Gymnopus androsaceus JB14 TaxID=1447944 RepID=A0A6A4HZ66_9AGAR|nr:hypothetical protein BT96DRAFT_916595 [Gymnopus androsaceus JB14]
MSIEHSAVANGFITPAEYVEIVVRPFWVVTMFAFLFYGAYTVLVWIYIYLQLHQRRRKRPYFYQISLLCLYLLISIVTILSTLSLYQSTISSATLELVSSQPSFNPDNHYALFQYLACSSNGIFLVANTVADAILLSRCYFIWGSRKTIIVGPAILCGINLGLEIASLVLEIEGDISTVTRSLRNGSPDNITATIIIFAFVGGTIFANTLLTGLIAGRIWRLSQINNCYPELDKVNKARINSKQIYRLVAIIIESGALYPISIIVALVIELQIHMDVDRLLLIVAQTMGIAPTLILVRVDLGSSIESPQDQSKFTARTHLWRASPED